MKSIGNLPKAENTALVNRLMALCDERRFIARHEWQVGDVLIWNDTGTVHRVVRSVPERHVPRLHKRGVPAKDHRDDPLPDPRMSATTETTTSTRYNTPLRQAQRDLTRSRIKNAARELFYKKHYDTTTMDEIAEAAGLRRSTLYLHYKDKAEILGDIIVEYIPKARAILATLPGPKPSLDLVHAWVKRVAKFVAKERAPLSIIQEARARSRDAAAFDTVIVELLRALGASNPKFAQAAMPDADPLLGARALMLLEELTYACKVFIEDTRDNRGRALLAVAAEDFHLFLNR